MALYRISTQEERNTTQFITYTKDGMEFIIEHKYETFNLMVDTDVFPAIPLEGVEGGYNASRNDLNLPYNTAYHEAGRPYRWYITSNNMPSEELYNVKILLKGDGLSVDLNNLNLLVDNGWTHADTSVKFFGPIKIEEVV